MHRSKTHQNQSSGNPRRSVCEGCKPPITSARISTLLPSSPIPPRRHPLALRPSSHPFRSLLFFLTAHTHPSRCFSFIFCSTATTASAYIAANLPRPSFFAIFFTPSLSPLPFTPPFTDESRRWGRRRVSRGCSHRHRWPASSV